MIKKIIEYFQNKLIEKKDIELYYKLLEKEKVADYRNVDKQEILDYIVEKLGEHIIKIELLDTKIVIELKRGGK